MKKKGSSLKTKTYFRIEAFRMLIYPLFLAMVTWFVVDQGWISPEYAEIAWAIVGIQTVACLLCLVVSYVIEVGK